MMSRHHHHSHQGAAPLISLLQAIFSQAQIQVSLAGLTKAERDRNITFYDEIVPISVRLSIPASDRTLPAPSDEYSTSFAIPLGTGKQGVDEENIFDEDDGLEQRSAKPPILLTILLACLHISLEAAYVPPRLQREPQSSASIQSELDSSSGTQVVASVDQEDAAYQSIRLRGNDMNMEATQMFQTSWSGNSLPPKADLKKPSSIKGKAAFATQNDKGRGGSVWFSRQDGQESWTIEWRCLIPIVFIRSRHPSPALVINSDVTLQLQASKLTSLAPSLAPAARTTASEALFLHDLLSPLSEGPSYPDESHAERAARTDASLAKLPLGKLPSSILGSKLVTPARGAREVGRLVEEKRRLANGDMGDMEEYNSLQVGKKDLTDEGLLDFSKNVKEEDSGLGEDSIVVKRSARRALDVRSAVQVRMRTTNIAGVGEQFGEKPNSDDAEDSMLPTLILCVEIENPANSGVRFAMDDISVKVTLPNETQNGAVLHPTASIQVKACQIGMPKTEMIVEQGSQHNLLYRVDFRLPRVDDLAKMNGLDPSHLVSETQRTITIELFGHPILLQKSDTKFTPAESFTSTWSCTLDFATQIQSLILQRLIAEGAGGYTLGPSSIDERNLDLSDSPLHDPNQQTPNANTDNKAVLPSVVNQKRIGSVQLPPIHVDPRSASVSRQAASTAPIRPSVSRVKTDFQSPSTSIGVSTMASSAAVHHRPSLRSSASGAYASDTFISLQQRTPDVERQPRESGDTTRRDSYATAPMPSSMVGPSILARARQNRNASLQGNSLEFQGSRNVSGGRRTTLISNTRITSDVGENRMSFERPGRMSSSSWHLKNALSGSQTVDLNALPTFPLGSKTNWARLPSLVHQASKEQGMLIEVTALAKASSSSDVENVDEFVHVNAIDIQIQIDNRSNFTRTILLQWDHNGLYERGRTSPKLKWLPDDDAVQVGPIAPGQAELTILRLCSPSSLEEKPFTVPPIVLIDVETGIQQILTCVQSLSLANDV